MDTNEIEAIEGVENREELTKLLASQGYKIGAEIGVWRGRFSAILCRNIPDLTLYCIDHWSGTRRQLTINRINETKRNLAPYPKSIIWKKSSHRAARHIPDKSLDFVYIDAAHDYAHVMEDLNLWEPKVRIGGMVTGHDYQVDVQMQVFEAVNDYVKAHPVELYRTKNEEEFRSFYWIKR